MISLRDFRGFHHQDFIEVRPITLLVGENSAGKSSFLAALKYILDFTSGDEEASFNKDPFQLGTFQQISHYRGGKAGRAKQFSLSLQKRVRTSVSRKDNPGRSQDITFQIDFGNIEHQASISSLLLKSYDDSVRLYFEKDRIFLDYISPGGRIYKLGDSHSFPRISRADLSRYWRFILRDFGHRISRVADESEDSKIPESVQRRLSVFSSLASTLTRRLSGSVEATSAIRTKPLRTYTPGIERWDGEGSHVPFEMAKLYRSRNKDSWRNIKTSIDQYGKDSDMFKEVGIKSFGSTASDPFQIQFSSDGPRTNLVDLGYGTSQVLPILYVVSSGDSGNTYLIQQPEVHLHPKAQASLGEFFIESHIKDKKRFILETHSDFIVDRVRSAVAAGRINRADVSILFFERNRLENKITKIDLNELGDPVDPPLTYRNFFIDEQMKVLGIG